MPKTLQTKISIELATDITTLWEILTSSKYTKQYMFNCEVISDWKIGNTIEWKGTYEGYEAYQKGEILNIKPLELIQYSTFDPNFGLEDIPQNYIHVTYLLESKDGKTFLTIQNETFDGNEERLSHINQGWEMVIKNIEELIIG